MSTINLQVLARDVKVGDKLDAYPTQGIMQPGKQGTVRFTYNNSGVTYLWLVEHSSDNHPADVILNHGDPCRITREREPEPTRSRWEVVGPDDASLVDVYDNTEPLAPLALPGVDKAEALDLAAKLTDAFTDKDV